MMTDPKITFTYDPDLHKTICRRAVHNKIYIGTAKCHPSDYDFESHRELVEMQPGDVVEYVENE